MQQIRKARRKVFHALSEVSTALLMAGCDKIDTTIERKENGFLIRIQSPTDAKNREQLRALESALMPPVRNPALAEEYWELTGTTSSGGENELFLVGHVVSSAAVTLQEGTMEITLFISFSQKP